MNFNDIETEDINLVELKTLTANAQTRKREEEHRKRQEEYRKQQLEIQRLENEAKAVIQTIPFIVKQAASKGSNSATIIELKREDFKRTFKYSNRHRPEQLELKAKLIWDYLEQKGLNPTFYTAHDGFGEKSWDYIKANW